MRKGGVADDQTRAAGRGGLAILGAKVSFIVLGFVQQLLLSRVLSAEDWGDVALVLAIGGILNNVVVATSIQGVSKQVSSAPGDEAKVVFRRVLGVHTTIAIVLAVIFALLATKIADFEQVPRLTSSLRLVAIVVFLYGLYAPLVGALNGMRRFGDQAALDVGYQILRTGGLIGGAILMMRAGKSGVLGAVAGFVSAAAIILPAALFRAGIGEPGQTSLTPRKYLRDLAPLFAQQAALSVLMQTDFIMLARFLNEAAAKSAAFADAAEASAQAARFVAVQRGVQLFGFLPYQLLMSITFVLFPLLARAKSLGSKDEVRSMTIGGVRLSVIVTGLMSATVAALAPHLLRFAFANKPEVYTYGATALRIYAVGFGAFSVLGVTTAALVSLSREVRSLSITAFAIVAVALASTLIVRPAELGEPMLIRSAIAVSIALLITLIVAAASLDRVAGAFTSPLTIARVALAMAATIAVGTRFPWLGLIGAVVEAAIAAAIYVTVLVVTRELGAADLQRIKQVVGRK